MRKKVREPNGFFKTLWHEIEPFVKELFVYSFVILTVKIVTYFIEPYLLDEKLKSVVSAIKRIVVIGSLSLFAFHTLIAIFIRVIVEVIGEGKDGYAKIRENRKTKQHKLNPTDVNFDEISEIQDSENLKVEKLIEK